MRRRIDRWLGLWKVEFTIKEELKIVVNESIRIVYLGLKTCYKLIEYSNQMPIKFIKISTSTTTTKMPIKLLNRIVNLI